MPPHPMFVAFDADDTLWHNEDIFERTHMRYREKLAGYHDAATVDRALLATERKNLPLYGYGIKGFTLSAIETAIQLTGGRIPADEVSALLELGREMLEHPVELIAGALEVLQELHPHHTLILITKGDLRDQERKLEKSRLAPYFSHVEIVSEKDRATYSRLLDRHGIPPARFLMVGNSLKSDIHPVVSLGGMGFHVPYRITWALEQVQGEPTHPERVVTLNSLRELPEAIRRIRW